MKLDKYWKYQKGMNCPFCGRKRVFYDEHDDKDATHVCKACNEIFSLVGSGYGRGVEE